jgi:hypothetical protein
VSRKEGFKAFFCFYIRYFPTLNSEF